jgi:hypothetical protein
VAVDELFPRYGLFVIAAMMAERRSVFRSLGKALRIVGKDLDPEDARVSLKQKSKDGKAAMDDPFFRPYVNVVRMHLLIFFFGFCHFLKIDSFFIFTAVYLVYFFPWDALKGENSGRTQDSPKHP